MPDDAPTDGGTGEDEELWFGDEPASEDPASDAPESDVTDGAGAPLADGEDDDRLPSAVGGSKGRMVAGLVLVLFGIAVAVAAVSQRGSDDGTSSAGTDEPAAEGTQPEASTSTTAGVRTPTTLPGGVLPTGCADWDGTFGFEPEPVEGVAVWSDFDGWHIRVGPEGPEVVTGTVTGQVVPALGNQFRPAGVDVSADPATATVVFSITPGSEPIGFDFAADCAQKQLAFQFWGPDGEPLPVDQVQVGRNGSTDEMPFYAQRTMAEG